MLQLDAKKSPLALLAQTCSQIGADSPNTKPLISTLDKPKKSTIDSGSRTSPSISKDHHTKQRSSPQTSISSASSNTVAFKPYENNVTKKSEESVRPSSKPSDPNSVHNSDGKKTPGSNKSATPISDGKNTPVSDRKSTSPASSSTRGASPIIRSGLEILQGHQKDLQAYKGLSPMSNSALCCPPGLDPSNPAFRQTFGSAHHHHAAMAAMLAAGYPATNQPGATPYVSYARVKTPAGGEALVPVCKDPYCTGCQFSMHNQQLLMAAAAASSNQQSACPSGCTQCDHQKYNLAMAAMLGGNPGGSSLAPQYGQLGNPYICNWIAGESYCGKRFRTSEELLSHLRTHTSGSSDNSSSAAAAAQMAAQSMLNPLFSSAALQRFVGYPNPPLSPLSAAAAAARYHPYAKPGMPPSSLGASPYSAFNPAALNPYYSPYSLYGQRLGAAVHP